MFEIYSGIDEYKNVIKYFSNACGDMFNGDKDITYNELPEELKTAYDTLWEEGSGSYCYLVNYKDQYGVVLINEYHEFDEYGKEKDPNNFCRAVEVAEKFSKEFPLYGVCIAKEIGFPGCGGDDPATELIVFVPYADTKANFNNIAGWLYENAYVKI